MGDLVNLRTVRKRDKRRQAEQQAAANRLAHGRSKAQRDVERARNAEAAKTLSQHRIEKGDGQ